MLARSLLPLDDSASFSTELSEAPFAFDDELVVDTAALLKLLEGVVVVFGSDEETDLRSGVSSTCAKWVGLKTSGHTSSPINILAAKAAKAFHFQFDSSVCWL